MTTQPPVSQPLIDPVRVLRLAEIQGPAGMSIRRMIADRVQAGQQPLEQAREAWLQGNIEAACQRLHALRGSFATLGALPLGECLLQLEQALRAEGSSAKDFAPAERLFAETLAWLKTWCERFPIDDQAVAQPLRRDDLCRLVEWLEGGDFQAVECFEQLRGALRPRLDPAAFQRLADWIQIVEFELAAQWLRDHLLQGAWDDASVEPSVVRGESMRIGHE